MAPGLSMQVAGATCSGRAASARRSRTREAVSARLGLRPAGAVGGGAVETVSFAEAWSAASATGRVARSAKTPARTQPVGLSPCLPADRRPLCVDPINSARLRSFEHSRRNGDCKWGRFENPAAPSPFDVRMRAGRTRPVPRHGEPVTSRDEPSSVVRGRLAALDRVVRGQFRKISSRQSGFGLAAEIDGRRFGRGALW